MIFLVYQKESKSARSHPKEKFHMLFSIPFFNLTHI